MALQQLKEHRLPVWQMFPIIETIAGFGNTQNLTAFSGGPTAVLAGGNPFSNATSDVSFGMTYLAGVTEYDPDFVKSVLQADAAAPEASFTNVVDMLDWLNRG